MSFLKKIKGVFKKPAMLIALAVLSFGFYNIVQANGIITPFDPTAGGPNQEGYVYGFAWMGTNIPTPPNPDGIGGGGWLKFNCEPNDCGQNGSNRWGVRIDLRSAGQTDVLGGYTVHKFTGEAWSPNYGFLTFDPSIVSSCWTSNPGTFQGVASVTNYNIQYNTDLRKIGGWAKFIAGDDFPTGSVNDDGWDGCVNFGNELNSPVPYGVQLNIVTGDLIGWAWGGPVVGWISFKNPECPFCDTSIVLPNMANINFWADQTVIQSGGGTTLRWQAANSSTRNVASCRATNSSGYLHWAPGSGASNVGPITTTAGNLPAGSHPINNITQATTYTLNCRDNVGAAIPPKYVNIFVNTDILGCTSRFADNYNPLATIDDGSCVVGLEVVGCMDPTATNYVSVATIDSGNCVYGPTGTPTVTLNMVTNIAPNILPVGSSTQFDYQVSPRWSFTNPSQVASCTGSFVDHNGTTRVVSGWSDADLPTPTASSYSAGPYSSTNNVYDYSTLPGIVDGSQFKYTISCLDTSGNPFSDTAPVVFRRVNPPAAPRLTLDVATSTVTAGVLPHDTGNVTWWTSSTPSSFVDNSCVGSVTVGGNTVNLPDWTGARSNPVVQGGSNSGNPISNINFNNLTSGLTAQTTLRFRVNCQSTGGQSITASDNVIFQPAPVNPPEPLPIVDLTIPTPNNNYGLIYEQLTSAGANVTFDWTVQNAVSCTGTSGMLNQGPNNLWNSNTFNPVAGSLNINMTAGGAYYYPGFYTLTCVNSEGGSGSDTVAIGIDGVPCPVGSPECPVPPGSNIPGYEEF